MDIESIDDLFPFDSYRPKQRETMMAAMEKLFLDDYDNLIIDAPTGVGKCLTGDTLVHTDDGLVRLENIEPNSHEVVSYREDGEFTLKNVKARFDKGKKDTLRVTTARGYDIEGTPDHKIKVMGPGGEFEWVRMGDLNGDEYIPLSCKLIESSYKTVPKPPIDEEWNRYESRLDDPVEVDEKLANFLGWVIADGNVDGNRIRITCHDTQSEAITKVAQAAFPRIEPTVGDYNGRSAVDINVSSVEVVRLVEQLCYDGDRKKIPEIMYRSPLSVRSAFIRGLFGGDGTVNKNNIEYYSKEETLVSETQKLLLSLGILSQKAEKNTSGYESWVLRISGSDLLSFKDCVGTFYTTSEHTIGDLINKERNPNKNTLPNVDGLLNTVWDQFKNTDHDVDLHRPSGIAKIMQSYRYEYAGPKKPSKNQLRKFLTFMDVQSSESLWLQRLIDMPVKFDQIEQIEASSAEVYDINVPDLHNYVANGFISHNSAINIALARSQESAYYVTPQKSLREQLMADPVLSKHYNGLKGRRDYTCGVTGNNCKECEINQNADMSCRDFDQCAYWKAKEKAMYSDIAILTFAYLIVDGNIPEFVGGDDGSERLSFQEQRELVIVDECHSLEQQVASLFAGFKISPWILPAEVYEGLLTHVSMNDVSIHTDVRAELEELYDRCESYIDEHHDAEEMQSEVQDCRKMHTKLEWLFTEVDEYDRAWVVNMEKTKFSGRWQKVMEMKPVHVDHFLKNFVWSRGKKRILSTATMPYRDKPEFWCTRIGLDPDRTHVIQVGMPFPKENRPIHTKSMIAEMSNGGDKKHWPEIMGKLDELSNFHAGQKGLIHTASYNRAEKVYNSAKTGKWKNLKGNVVLHEGDHNADDVIAKWQNSNQDLLVTPSMTEGVDLDGDKCRWQALLKVPFPYPGDSRVDYLLNEQPEIGWPWYWETTANQIIQSVGRAVRSRDDYANYYVLDKSFEKVRSKVAFPGWFEEAIDVGPAQRAKNSPMGW